MRRRLLLRSSGSGVCGTCRCCGRRRAAFGGGLRLKVFHKGKHLNVHRRRKDTRIHKYLANIFLVCNLVPMRLDLRLGHHLVMYKDFRHVLVSHRKSLRLNHQLAIAKNTPIYPSA